jgi:hypothetical protein
VLEGSRFRVHGLCDRVQISGLKVEESGVKG